MMHREVVAKKKVPVIAISLLVITVVLYLFQGIKSIGLDEHIIGDLLNTVLLIVASIVILKEFRGCSLSYKYAIISDKLMVNKINSKNEENLESIKICDIIYVGKKRQIPKEYSNIKNTRNYLCNVIREETYYCIYKNSGKVFKFAFQPSDKFIQTIIKHSCLCNE
ncbi:hypothetical protein [Clostridium gasigenes]|uniref:Uncharacterized protein n=1 Tax=Clostridium gasigenes TaxID=94869 RepID=A0A7X0SFQ4_9CLOT|nr:hypothetical protein [Clostridium gasigenes]MBB6625046.1 hypothetical protein [Clostridium gasigenes]MBB6715508.1 hypothetical protein [Clostridium gasigenes]MBU3088931.1 hypothetical protein [Clostridium gasigenes]MBU3104911.1 hypothetical protein [Clostridium gasigenes]MBU3108703.1 hypothetical protein [Clostridium gasigenes]